MFRTSYVRIPEWSRWVCSPHHLGKIRYAYPESTPDLSNSTLWTLSFTVSTSPSGSTSDELHPSVKSFPSSSGILSHYAWPIHRRQKGCHCILFLGSIWRRREYDVEWKNGRPESRWIKYLPICMYIYLYPGRTPTVKSVLKTRIYCESVLAGTHFPCHHFP